MPSARPKRKLRHLIGIEELVLPRRVVKVLVLLGVRVEDNGRAGRIVLVVDKRVGRVLRVLQRRW